MTPRSSRQHALTLPANPRAVRLAREWVGRVLAEIDRADLVPSAELGVSELVTNAIMHSTPPVAVRVRGTTAHPRIEVADRSLVPPRPVDLTEDLTGDDDLLMTFGRGLALVAVHSASWGSDLDDDGHGKTVWFEPVTEPVETVVEGDLFDLEEVMASRLDGAGAEETLPIALQATPVESFLALRRHYNELRRELRLLALANPRRYPLAASFSEVAMQAEQERRQTSGIEEQLALADRTGTERVDLTGEMPASAPETMARLRDLLAQVQDFFAGETALLSAQPTPALLALQDWYLEEFVRQGRGEEPQAWSGVHHGRHQTAS